MHELTFNEAVDVVSSVVREIGANHATIVSRVPGREAERVARSLDHEGKELNEALFALRKIGRVCGDLIDEAMAASQDTEPAPPPRPLAASPHPSYYQDPE